MVERETARTIEIADAEGVADAVLAQIERGEGGEVLPIGSARIIWAGPGSPLNCAYGLGFDGEVDAETLSTVIDFYRRRGAPAHIQLCPLAHDSLVARTREAGFGVLHFIDVLTRPLLRDEAIAPPSIAVLPVDPSDSASVLRLASVMARGFSDGAVPDPTFRLERTLVCQPNARSFAAEIGGEWVGAAIVGFGRGRASLFAGATLPEHRRKGVQTALITERLRAAQQQGASFAVTGAAPGVATRRNAERLGFRLAYTRVKLAAAAIDGAA